MIQVKVWGSTGSIPACMSQKAYQEKIIYALLEGGKNGVKTLEEALELYKTLPSYQQHYSIGSSSCYEILGLEDVFILDAGSGIRKLGIELINCRPQIKKAHLFLSHFHWDHILGLPFFGPFYHPDYDLHFYSGHPKAKERLADQQVPHHFPTTFDSTLSKKSFYQLKVQQNYEIGGAKISILPLKHPGGSYAYRFEIGSKIIVYATDGEYPSTNLFTKRYKDYAQFFKNADVLIFDAMYSFFETEVTKIDWGHSSPNVGVELAIESNVKHLVLAHHDPISTDYDNYVKTQNAIKYRDMYCKNYKKNHKPKISLAIEENIINLED